LLPNSDGMIDVPFFAQASGDWGCFAVGQDRSYIMKEGIHPEYKLTKITCVCGNVIETRSTVEDIKVEICSACHPFYTGKQKLVDTAGRIDRFNKRYGMKTAETK